MINQTPPSSCPRFIQKNPNPRIGIFPFFRRQVSGVHNQTVEVIHESQPYAFPLWGRWRDAVVTDEVSNKYYILAAGQNKTCAKSLTKPIHGYKIENSSQFRIVLFEVKINGI